MPASTINRLGIGLVVALAAIAYANTFDGEFVWDDVSSVLLHEHVHNPADVWELFKENQHAFSGSAVQGRFYRPLVAVSFMADFALSYDPATQGPTADRPYPDVSPFLFHLTNLVWHTLAALLLFLLLGRLGAPPAVRIVTALIYAVHPLHTEAVSYISGRADMMAAAFMFAGLLCALWSGGLLRRAIGAVLCGLCFLAGFLCKESAAIFPLLLLLVLLWRPQAKNEAETSTAVTVWLHRALPLLGMVAGGVIYAVLRSNAALPPAQETTAAGLATRLIEVGQALAFYLRTLFVPANLHMEQTLAGTPVWTAAIGYTFLLTCLAAIAGAWRTGHRRIVLALGWFLLTWFPISGIFPLNAPMAEHWMYVPMAGFWWAIAEGVHLAASSTVLRRTAGAAAAVLIIAYTGLTIERNQDWHSNVSLYEATLAENPATMRVHYNLAVTYEELVGNRAGAQRHFQEALALAGANAQPDAILSLGDLHFQQRRYIAASLYYGQLAGTSSPATAPYRPAAILGLGKSFLALGYVREATMALQNAAQQEPAFARRVRKLEMGAPL
ncbi:MAG: hypothetical protein ACLFTT_04600 [Candidatus Hydrogenedentota bacterium]